jgi:hypothetical protein
MRGSYLICSLNACELKAFLDCLTLNFKLVGRSETSVTIYQEMWCELPRRPVVPRGTAVLCVVVPRTDFTPYTEHFVAAVTL